MGKNGNKFEDGTGLENSRRGNLAEKTGWSVRYSIIFGFKVELVSSKLPGI